MKIPPARIACLASAIAIAVSTLAPAHAATASRTFATNPAGICQAALPVFDGVIRKRPKAVANEGTSSAFITCAWTSQGSDTTATGESPVNPTQLRIYFSSIDGAQRGVSCTAVLGYQGQTLPSVTRGVGLQGSQTSELIFTPQNFGFVSTFPSAMISVSCSLPPNVAINDSYLFFNEEIGS